MRRTQALLILLIPLLLCMIITPSYSNELYDEEQITVEGQVNKPLHPESAQNVKDNSKDTVQWRKRREQPNFQTPPPAATKSYSINVVARAYCLGGFTSRGNPTRVGVVAVDPRIIPFGSRIFIPGYGWGTALDTGGAIQGNSIDIWMPTYSQCMQWGVRSLTIKIVKP